MVLQILGSNLLAFTKAISRSTSTATPQICKWKTMYFQSRPGAFIETGTHRGHTSLFLSRFATFVITIEPSPYFQIKAEKLFGLTGNIQLLRGTSESELEKAIKILIDSGESNVNFWLDGHFSDGKTFLGEVMSPILFELDTIAKYSKDFCSITIFIDDLRLFRDHTNTGYPSEEKILLWAQRNSFEIKQFQDILRFNQV